MGSQETGTSFHATKDQRFDYGRTLKNKSISYKSLSREGFSLYTERVIPLLTQEQKHKHLKFAKHYLNNWGLGAGKFILFHYDEKWFWGLLLRKTAKTFEEFEEKMKKKGYAHKEIRAYHKNHISKTMGIAFVGFAFIDSMENGGDGIKLHFTRKETIVFYQERKADCMLTFGKISWTQKLAL